MSGTIKKGNWFIGTSGWQYKHWKERFYPNEVKAKDWLAFYSGFFKTVELNSSFYHQPTKKVFAGWEKAAAAQFIFAVKAPRFFTHLKKLSVTRTELNVFIDAAEALSAHLGPILFQLPPRWHFNLERMASFIRELPAGLRITFEFRDRSWYEPELYALLEQNDIAFCVYELGGHKSPVMSTASFVYIRLHGPGKKYSGSYTDTALKEWSRQIKEWTAAGKDVYLYFDNDQSAYAPHNAIKLLELLNSNR